MVEPKGAESVASVKENQSKKHFWNGCKLPSMGCLITVFQYYGYRQQIESLLKLMSRQGASFYHAHLENESTEMQVIDLKP